MPSRRLLLPRSSPSGADAFGYTLHATDDAYIQTDKPGKNKGADEKIKLKDDGGDDDRVGFGKFDISTGLMRTCSLNSVQWYGVNSECADRLNQHGSGW